MNKLLIAFVLAGGVAGAVVACTGDQGIQGEAGGPGKPGQDGTNGTPGEGGPPGEAGASSVPLTISAEAQQGLAISPVQLSLAGLTSAEVEALGDGSYLVNAVAGCGDCHNQTSGTTTNFLAGGTQYALGGTNVVTARNLTPESSTGMKLSRDEFVQTMRTGADFATVSADGGAPTSSLLVMPWATFRWMSTADLEAIYAYLRALPPIMDSIAADVKPAVPPVPFPSTYTDGAVLPAPPLPPEFDAIMNPVPDPGYALRGAALATLDVSAPTDATQAAAFGRGSYLVNSIGACNDCHTNPDRDPTTLQIDTASFLTGGRVFIAPAPLAITLGVVRSMSADLLGTANGFFTETAVTFPVFEALITQGVHADDPAPQSPLAWPMPWPHLRNMTLDDMEAVYTYLKTIALEAPFTGSADKPTQPAARYCASSTTCLTGETCNTATNECVGGACTSDRDCGACQTCGSSSTCVAPDAASACLTAGL
jgi:mono/diheme cytochrome c family protein